MEPFARFVVKHRRIVLITAVLLLIPSAVGAIATRINYDILTYLPPELDSMIGEQSLENDFHIAATGMVTLEGFSNDAIRELESEMEAVPGVSDVFQLNDVLNDSVPKDMLPKDLQDSLFGENDARLMIVRFEGAAASESTMNACKRIKTILREGAFFGGLSMILEDTKALIDSEMPWYIVCAVGASLFVLFLDMESTVVPPIFMLGLVFPIVYNLGSNIILGEISYITEALATVLQLGVTMDFSIFLLDRYREEKRKGADKETAMVHAIINTGTAISASSLTTIAGFLALCSMRLTLGKDIGLVMAKGVALGVLCTVTILPSLLIRFDHAIEAYQHRTFIPKFSHLNKWIVKRRMPILIAFVLIVVPFAYGQSHAKVYYNLFDSLPQDLTGIVGTNKLSEDFGMTTNHFILVSDEIPQEKIRQMDREIETVDGVTEVMGLEKFVGAGIPQDFLPSEITEILLNGEKRLILVNSGFDVGTDALNEQLTAVNAIVKRYDPNALITGEGALTKDLIEVADVDFQNVSVSSIAAVFLIVALSFKSISIPALLVSAIESAIFINMGIPYFTGSELPFIASIVIGTIQLGATVDYAILMTTRFREERQLGLDAKAAAENAIETCSQSILTSGLTFFAATFGVSLISRMDLLESLCLLIARGALISVLVILFVLPCLLIVTEPILRRTTKNWLSQPKPRNIKSFQKKPQTQKENV